MLEKKRILITGATDGIGKETAKSAAKQGAELIVFGKEQKRIDDTIKELLTINKNGKFLGVNANFLLLENVNEAAEIILEKYSHIDIMFNNAADFFPEKETTKNGFERTYQVNYLAPFLLTHKLLPLIKNKEGSKLLNVSSMIHASIIDFDNLQGEKKYSGSDAYSLSKLLNILHTYKLADVLSENNTTVNCLHPGVIETKLLNAAWSGGAPLKEGAETMLYAATSPITEQMSGLYLENRRPMQSNPVSYDKETQNKLWEFTLKQLKDYLS